MTAPALTKTEIASLTAYFSDGGTRDIQLRRLLAEHAAQAAQIAALLKVARAARKRFPQCPGCDAACVARGSCCAGEFETALADLAREWPGLMEGSA